MDKNYLKMMELKLEVLQKRLENRNFKVSVVEDENQLADLIKNMIADKSVVSFGGSETLKQAKVLDLLHSMDITLLDRYDPNHSASDIQKVFRDSFFADYYFTSTNSISMTGSLFNIDNNGNRVAAMTFGPKNVVVICGLNKICDDDESAKLRARNVASPANCIRLNRDTPCAKIGSCANCNSPDRLCNVFVETARSVIKDRIHVVFVKKELGY